MSYALLQLLFVVILYNCCQSKFNDDWLEPVTPDQLLKTNEDGDCYFPPFCNLNVTQCNVDRVNAEDMTFTKFYNEYYKQERPVIIRFGPDVTRSNIITNTTLFEWHNIASILTANENEYKEFVYAEEQGTPLARTGATKIIGLDARDSPLIKHIYNNIHTPSWFSHESMDIFNDLLGYLSSSDEHDLYPNKWFIIGATGGGASFHFDYYFTSFWNFVVQGSKYWVLVPPEDVLKIWHNSDLLINRAQSMNNIEWFDQIYLNGFLDKAYERLNSQYDGTFEYYRCIQEQGDLWWTPSLLYHSTVNLDATLSVSQNLVAKDKYNLTFDFLAKLKRFRHTRLGDDDYDDSWNTLELCAALYKFDVEMFEKSVCAKQALLDKWDADPDPDYSSAIYDMALNFAKDHAQYSDFRV